MIKLTGHRRAKFQFRHIRVGDLACQVVSDDIIVRIDEWLLFELYSPFAGNGRGLALGYIYTAEGELVASAAQEGLMRVGRE